MCSNIKFTPEEKLNLLLKYYELKISLSQFCREFNVERTAIVRWNIKYEVGGPSTLKRIKTKTEYSSNTLINSVKEYLQTECSMLDVVKKYKLSGDSVLRTWLKWYNTPKWKKNLGVYMSREKITSEKKLELTLEVINKNRKIKQIAEENNITQHQLRNWVRNYKIKGIEALNDNRGITKKYETLTSEEILKLKLKESEEKYLRLEAEFELTKKLMALRAENMK
ncbi:MAG: transposase [Fusobacteriaceae bacterium]